MLWERHPAEMTTSLEKHDEILARSIAACHGELLKSTGDGAVAIFDSAGDAIAAAMTSQEQLGAESWSPATPIRVRMGLHTGETEARSGDHFGPTMNRAARIMSAGHGGQVLASAMTIGQAGTGIGDDVLLLDLGHHRLKDLTEPEHIFQVSRDPSSTFPTLRTLDAAPHNLPFQTSEFLGRTAELDAIVTIVGATGTRLATITGPGGAGKTRLALQVAAELVNEFADGVFFVDLSNETEPGAAFDEIARTIRIPEAGRGDSLQILSSRLRDKELLLVLDNLEQVTSAGAGIIELLASAPRVKVLVTSRETLKVRGEKVYPVPPLSLPDPRRPIEEIREAESVQLFLDRARAVQPDFAITTGNAATVAEICLRLDGLPLAIELAAARLRMFTPADLLTRLEQRLDAVGSGGRDLPDRQRTLWGAIDWSYELLAEDEKDLFEAMGVFSGADVASVEAVAQQLGMTDFMESLESLIDKSLVSTDVSGRTARVSMLLMIKEFAQAKLSDQPDREGEVRAAHAAHYLDVATRLRTALGQEDLARALADVDSERGNLRTAWKHTSSVANRDDLMTAVEILWSVYEAGGWYHAAIEMGEEALAAIAPGQSADALVIQTSVARAMMAVHGYNEDVEAAFTRGLQLADAVGTPAQRAAVLRAFASYYTLSARIDKALDFGRQLLDLGEEIGDDAVLAEGHCVVGVSYSFAVPDAALSNLRRTIELRDRMGRPSSRFQLGPRIDVIARAASGLTLLLTGAIQSSVQMMEDAVLVAQTAQHPYSLAYAIYHSGYHALLLGRHDQALAFARELSDISGRHEYAIWQTLATVLEGAARSGAGDPEAGIELTESGIRLYRGLTTPPVFWPLLLAIRAQVHAQAGQIDRALELIDQAIETGSSPDGELPMFRAIKASMMMMTPEPRHEEAKAELYRELASARALGFRMVEVVALTELVALGDRSAVAELRESVDHLAAPEEFVVKRALAVIDGLS